ncbi:MAG: T9SS type A sorting domain-containing protein [Bacteroidetes bacterium]|nr:T9SS type A sorting domain-containing protein [Bacteroidota bacterium]
MHRILPVFLFFAFSVAAQAQGSFYKFFPGFETPFITSVYPMHDGLICCFQNQNSTTLEISRRIVKTDFDGNTSWIMVPDSSNYSIQYACEPQPGATILGGFYSISGQFGPQGWGLITRIDENGNVIWAKRATAQTSGGLTGVYSNGQIIYALFTSYSNFSNSQMYSASVIAYDLDGNKLWEVPYGHSGFVTNYYFEGATVAENGDFIGAIDVRGSQNVQVSGIVLTRITPQGVVSWTKHINWHADFSQSTANGVAEGPDGSIYVGCRLMTDQSSIYPNALWIGKFGADGEQLDQRMYSAGTDVGENISGMTATENHLLVYVKRYSPFEAVQRQLDLLAIDYEDLSVFSAKSSEVFVTFESVYGEDPPQLAMGPDGSAYTSAISFCDINQKNYSSIFKWNTDLETGCNSTDVTGIYTDSVSAFTAVDYVNSGFNIPTYANADNINFIHLAVEQAPDFCDGCDISTGLKNISPDPVALFYPNPAKNNIVLRTDIKAFTLSDLSGRIILSDYTQGKQSISIEGIPAGIYLLNLDGLSSKLIIAD